MANPRIPDINTIIAAGLDPKTGIPIKFGGCSETLVEDIKRVLRVIDEQNAVNRYKWFNLPDSLDGELLERILYYRGQAAFFFEKVDKSFKFLPFALNGTIDIYGRYTGITPLQFNGTANDGGKSKIYINGLRKNPVYGIKYDELTKEDVEDGCVILTDYCRQISQTIIPRQVLNEPILKVEAECVPLMRTSMILGTGVKGMRVNDADQADSVRIASKSIEHSAMVGEAYVPILGNIEFQELTDSANLKGADYMQAMQSIDNLRLSTYGIESGGIFEKKAHLLETEAATMGGSVGLVYQDGLRIRQEFCNIVNSIWGLGIWVEPSESVMGGDVNRDGVGYDINQEQGQDMTGGNNNDTNV